MMERLIENAAQLFLLLALAPLVTGVIRTLKARLQTRRGPGILQPYRDLGKLFGKGMVVPETASWIFAATPWVVFFSTVLAGLMIPMVAADAPLGLFGGVLAVIYLLGLGRFFLALSGMDTGSSFGGLGSSREMTISALAEPAMMLAIFTVAIGAGSTGLTEIAGAAIGQHWRFLAPAQMFAFAALALVLIAETGRIPVDNPATHLELTMIHEAMILEYSGPYLALVEWAASIKQLVLMTLLDQLLLAVWPAAGVVRLRRGAGNRLAAGEAAVVELRDCSAGDRERQDAAFPCPRTAGGGLYPGIARAGFHVPLLMLMRHCSRSAIRRPNRHSDGGAGAGPADRDGGPALDRHPHPHLRGAIVLPRHDCRHHRLVQPRAASSTSPPRSPWWSR